MKFGAVEVAQAEGAILAHSERLAKGRLRKGRVLTADDLALLAQNGISHVTVARLETGDIHEDTAADRIAGAVLGDDPAVLGLRASVAATGRVNLFSDIPGVAEVDADKVNAFNAIDPMITIATVPRWQRMRPGGMVATIKIISYAVPDAALAQAEAIAPGMLRMRAATLPSALLVQTTVAGDDGQTGHKAVAERLDALGVRMEKRIVAHTEAAISDALDNTDADLILILTGSATSDIRDTAPEAVRRAGGEIEHYGMPVDPGNLLFLGHVRGKPVIGLPGCARSPALNGADWVLERVVCGVPVRGSDIAAMGVGGLLKEIPTRPRPRQAPPQS